MISAVKPRLSLYGSRFPRADERAELVIDTRQDVFDEPVHKRLLHAPSAIRSVTLASGQLVTPASAAALALGQQNASIARVQPFSIFAQNNPGRTTQSAGPFAGPILIRDLFLELTNGGNVDAGFGLFWDRSQPTQLADSASVTTLPGGTPIFSPRLWIHSGVSAFDEIKNVLPTDNIVGQGSTGPVVYPLDYLITDTSNNIFLTVTIRNANGTSVGAKGLIRFFETVDPSALNF